jgi:hypothetical protein
LQGGVMTIIITLCIFCLGHWEERRKEGSKGAFTVMLDTRTLGFGTEDRNSSGRELHTPAPRAQQHTAYTQGRLMWIAR